MTHEDLKNQDDADVRALLRTREGARFFARLLELTRVFEISYIPHDAHGTAFNIAWQRRAETGSMIEALRVASRLARTAG